LFFGGEKVPLILNFSVEIKKKNDLPNISRLKAGWGAAGIG
jgi:hypothetical protein